jgi:hypothetical protein
MLFPNLQFSGEVRELAAFNILPGRLEKPPPG